jgi:hypothetical protein
MASSRAEQRLNSRHRDLRDRRVRITEGHGAQVPYLQTAGAQVIDLGGCGPVDRRAEFAQLLLERCGVRTRPVRRITGRGGGGREELPDGCPCFRQLHSLQHGVVVAQSEGGENAGSEHGDMGREIRGLLEWRVHAVAVTLDEFNRLAGRVRGLGEVPKPRLPHGELRSCENGEVSRLLPGDVDGLRVGLLEQGKRRRDVGIAADRRRRVQCQGHGVPIPQDAGTLDEGVRLLFQDLGLVRRVRRLAEQCVDGTADRHELLARRFRRSRGRDLR